MKAPRSSSPREPRNFVYSGKIVRRATVVDIEAVRALAASVSTVARWSQSDYESYCVTEQQHGEAQVKALFVACVSAKTQQNPAVTAAIPYGGMAMVGFAAFSAIFHAVAGECELENMAVAEQWRRQGIGARLLAAGELWCRSWRLGSGMDAAGSDATPNGLRLEVRASNIGAIAFYRHMGFVMVGRRSGYYTQPVEDAILMRLP